MHKIVLLLPCLACVGHGKQVYSSTLPLKRTVSPLEALAELVLSLNPASGFCPSALKASFARGSHLGGREMTQKMLRALPRACQRAASTGPEMLRSQMNMREHMREQLVSRSATKTIKQASKLIMESLRMQPVRRRVAGGSRARAPDVFMQLNTSDPDMTLPTKGNTTLWQEYLQNLVKPQALQCCLIYSAADIVVQLSSNGYKILNLDFMRVFSYALFALYYSSGFLPILYNRLDRWFGLGKAFRVVFPKHFIEMFVHAPFIYLPAFYMTTGLVQGFGWSGSLDLLRDKYRETLVSFWGIWVIPMLVFFLWVPTSIRVLYLAVLSFIEMSTYSFLGQLPAGVSLWTVIKGKLCSGCVV